ncbi:uncharacterized protein LOC117649706 isoform X2 [Thrips palmi]|uniref:Uncharacterized protein LOC117649706 isoform X2 n=1 Tax=Thrips palmi TaxID=161013 RepID=A0A6P8ZTJ5_THRPL|nr:uncharacterized protein LOC117649706 isoform X2 [Thrips palmi]
MPGGGALQRLAPGSIGLVEYNGKIIDPASTNFLVPVHYRTTSECEGLVSGTSSTQWAEDEFCAETTVMDLEEGGAAGTAPMGYALSVMTDGLWYLRGVLSGSRQSDVLTFASLDDPEALEWVVNMTRLDTQGDKAGWRPAQETSGTSPTTPSATKMSITTPAANLPTTLPTDSPLQKTTLPLASLSANQSLPGHLPWTVGVYVQSDRSDNDYDVYAGALVADNVVMTDGNGVVVPYGRRNDTGDVRLVAPGKLHVVWMSPNGKKRRVEVASLHVHERDRGAARDHAWNVALLVLKTPIKNGTLACLDLAGRAPAQPPLVPENVGVTETWRGNFVSDRRVLVALSTLGLEDCHARLLGRWESEGRSLTDDRICTAKASEEVWKGAALLARRGDSWFLRGILCFSFADGHVFTDLNGDSVRNWLREKLHSSWNNDLPEVKTISPLPGARHFFFDGLALDLGLISLFVVIAAAGAYFLLITFWPNRSHHVMASRCQCFAACKRLVPTPAARHANTVATDQDSYVDQHGNSDDEETRPALAVIFNNEAGAQIQARE